MYRKTRVFAFGRIARHAEYSLNSAAVPKARILVAYLTVELCGMCARRIVNYIQEELDR
jgi:hypothetical protein